MRGVVQSGGGIVIRNHTTVGGERRLVGLIEGSGLVVDTRWAKLVDDAVGVWEGKRKAVGRKSGLRDLL